jgi:hypothetical protein
VGEAFGRSLSGEEVVGKCGWVVLWGVDGWIRCGQYVRGGVASGGEGKRPSQSRNLAEEMNISMSGWWAAFAVLLLVAAIVLSAVALWFAVGKNGGNGSSSSCGGGSSSVSNFIALSSNIGAGLAQTGVLDFAAAGTTVLSLDDDNKAFNGTTTVDTWAYGTYKTEIRISGTIASASQAQITLSQLVNGVTNASLQSVQVTGASSLAAGVQAFTILLQCIVTDLAHATALTWTLTADSGASMALDSAFLEVERI